MRKYPATNILQKNIKQKSHKRSYKQSVTITCLSFVMLHVKNKSPVTIFNMPNIYFSLDLKKKVTEIHQIVILD